MGVPNHHTRCQVHPRVLAQSCAVATILGHEKEPLNSNDSDLIPNLIAPLKARDGLTDMLFCQVTNKVGRAAWERVQGSRAIFHNYMAPMWAVLETHCKPIFNRARKHRCCQTSSIRPFTIRHETA